ncbi:MAG: ParA family protein [Ruminococcaceae bacterium]|nr:ParA family protein [Oscillospiraceae bacterium]
MGKCIAVANQKGGVGKTTTSVNLSAALGVAGKKVLLIDLDPQGNATSGVGIDKMSDVTSIYDVIINDVPIKEAIIKTEFKNLSVIPATTSLAGAEIELVEIENRETRLKEKVSEIKDDYDFILIDCPPSLGLLTLNSFVCTDTILIPLQCEFFALEGLSQLVSTIRQVKKSLNKDIDIEGILLTMFDGRTNLSNQVADEIKKYYPDKVYKSVIPRNIRLSEAPSYGQPINVYDKHSKGAVSYKNLAKEVIKKNK